jgi:hypothetical protein
MPDLELMAPNKGQSIISTKKPGNELESNASCVALLLPILELVPPA